MFRVICVLAASLLFGCVQGWNNRGRVDDHIKFYHDAMQEMIYEIERRGFSSLTLEDYVIPFNLTLYNWQIVGNATYTNGFLVSIQKIDLTNIQQSIGNRVIDNVTIPHATVNGVLNLRDATVGFNVLAEIFESSNSPTGQFRYTGTFKYVTIALQFPIVKNLISGEITSTPSISSMSAPNVRMQFMPSSNITEVISRVYTNGNNNWDGVAEWNRNILPPIIIDVVTNKVPFPKVCFSHC